MNTRPPYHPAPQPRRKPTMRKAPAGARPRGGARMAAALCAVAAVVAVGAGAFALAGGFGGSGDGQPNAGDATGAANAGASTGDARVTFIAAGDNLPETVIGTFADACAGEVGDGAYDYRPVYAPVKPLVEAADLAYVKQEVHLGGDDIGPRGWPSFNTTDAMADAIVDTGFDLVGSASNHAYDWGYFGAVEHSRSVWNTKPVAFTGTATSDEEAAAIATAQANGVTVALLDYTYGVNGYAQADLPAYAVNFIDEERIRADVARARETADVVLVAMHWGTENQTEPDERQIELAQLLADLGVDVVLGSHPHVIQPVAWVEGASGHRTLVAYSLGNFVSRHETPGVLNELGGMLRCTFVKNGETGEVNVEDACWVPVVNHADAEGAACAVYPLASYTPELAATHRRLSQEEDPIGQLRAATESIIGNAIPIEA